MELSDISINKRKNNYHMNLTNISENSSLSMEYLQKQYKHLQLEFEILEDKVKNQEYFLQELKKENSILNSTLEKLFYK